MAAKKGLRRMVVGAVAAISVAALVACSAGGTTTDPDSEGGDDLTLRVAIPSFGAVEGFNPIKNPTTVVISSQHLVYGVLIDSDPETAAPAPGIVDSFTPSDDGMSWDFTLRPDVKFSDGSAATSEDLLYSLELYTREDNYRPDFRNVAESLEIVDDLTVRIHLNQAQPYLPYMFMSVTSPNLTSLVSKAYVEKVGLEEASQKPLGAGPWKLVDSTPGDSYSYTRNEYYFGEEPPYANLEVLQIPEAATQIDMLKTGALDLIQVAPDNLSQIEGFETFDGFAPQLRYDIWGAYDPRGAGMPTADIKVREALAHAIDYETIKDTVFGGIALDRMPPRTLVGHAEVDGDKWIPIVEDVWAYDPDKSKELLAEAGYPDGFDLKIFVPNIVSPMLALLAQVVQADWAKIGVNAEIVTLDGQRYLEVQGPSDETVGQVVFGGTATVGPAPVNINWVWGNGGNTTIADLRDPSNPQIFEPELLDLITSSLQESDPVERADQIDELIEKGLDTYTNYTFGQMPTVMALSPKWTVSGLPTVLTANLAPYFTRWIVPKS